MGNFFYRICIDFLNLHFTLFYPAILGTFFIEIVPVIKNEKSVTVGIFAKIVIIIMYILDYRLSKMFYKKVQEKTQFKKGLYLLFFCDLAVFISLFTAYYFENLYFICVLIFCIGALGVHFIVLTHVKADNFNNPYKIQILLLTLGIIYSIGGIILTLKTKVYSLGCWYFVILIILEALFYLTTLFNASLREDHNKVID